MIEGLFGGLERACRGYDWDCVGGHGRSRGLGFLYGAIAVNTDVVDFDISSRRIRADGSRTRAHYLPSGPPLTFILALES